MSTPGFRPTHVVPQHGMPAWETPDPARPTIPLDPLLPVHLVERSGDWAHVLCSNGWSAWVDGRLLVAVPQDPPAAGGPRDRTADPRPLLTRAEQGLARYRAAVEDLAGGALDGESFRARTRGLRVGVVVDGESVWLYDTDRSQWVHSDGTRVSTYATDDAVPHDASAAEGAQVPDHGPRPGGPAPEDAHPPTRMVPEEAHPPTRVMPEDAHPPTRVVPDHAGAGGAEPERPPAADRQHAPTRLVPGTAAPGAPAPWETAGQASGEDQGPEPTRLVGEEDPRAAAGRPHPERRRPPREPASDASEGAPPPAPESPPAAPAPTRIVSGDGERP